MSKRIWIPVVAAMTGGIIVIVLFWLGQRHRDTSIAAANRSPQSNMENGKLDARLPEVETYLPNSQEVFEEVKLIDHLRGLDNFSAVLRGELDLDPEKFAEFEAATREHVKQNGPPRAWINLAPKLTAQELKTISTLELAKACFTSSLLARRRLASSQSNPAYSIVETMAFYPAFDEFFSREDAWEGWLKAYFDFADALESGGGKTEAFDAQMGLTAINSLFSLPSLRKQVEGNEEWFIEAHLYVLKAIRASIDGCEDSSNNTEDGTFGLTLPTCIVKTALALMRQSSEAKAVAAIDEVSRVRIPKEYTMGDIKRYLDVCIRVIGLFCKQK